MAKLTRVQRRQVDAALAALRRATDYLRSDRTRVCAVRSAATTTLDYTRPDGAVLCEVDRNIGSDITGLDAAREALEALLAPQEA